MAELRLECSDVKELQPLSCCGQTALPWLPRCVCSRSPPPQSAAHAECSAEPTHGLGGAAGEVRLRGGGNRRCHRSVGT
jgi:hypothetical protein